MIRTERFTLRVTPTEQTMIGELARRLQRSQSDALRLIIREALRELERQGSPSPHVQHTAVAEKGEVEA